MYAGGLPLTSQMLPLPTFSSPGLWAASRLQRLPQAPSIIFKHRYIPSLRICRLLVEPSATLRLFTALNFVLSTELQPPASLMPRLGAENLYNSSSPSRTLAWYFLYIWTIPPQYAGLEASHAHLPSQKSPARRVETSARQWSGDSMPGDSQLGGEPEGRPDSTERAQVTGIGLTIGAAILMGGTFMITPLKEGSPARVILDSSEHLLKSRKKKEKRTGVLAALD